MGHRGGMGCWFQLDRWLFMNISLGPSGFRVLGTEPMVSNTNQVPHQGTMQLVQNFKNSTVIIQEEEKNKIEKGKTSWRISLEGPMIKNGSNLRKSSKGQHCVGADLVQGSSGWEVTHRPHRGALCGNFRIPEVGETEKSGLRREQISFRFINSSV